MNFRFIKIVVLVLMINSVHAQDTPTEDTGGKEEMVTDRPDQTESAMIVPKHSIQVETGFMFEHDEPTARASINNLTYNTTLLRIGLNQYFELRVIQEYLGSKVELGGDEVKMNGFSPLSIGAKIKVARGNRWVPETAFLGHITFPTGQDGFDQTHISGDFRFSMEYDLCERFSLGINLGGETDGETPNFTGIYTLVVGYSPIDRLGFFVESYGFITHKADMPHDHRFNAGSTFSITNLVQLDLSGGVGLSDQSPDYFISTGISFRLIN